MNNAKDRNLLFSKIADGDKKAFDAFFRQYYPKLIQFACIFIASKQQAEDVVADVLTSMLTRRDQVFRLAHFEAYLYSSVKNKALSVIKKEGLVNKYKEENLYIHSRFSFSDSPFELLVEKELSVFLKEIMDSLPPKRKMVFQLIREDGLSYREVAELMNISERTVEVHLKLAIQAFRECIENHQHQRKPKHSL